MLQSEFVLRVASMVWASMANDLGSGFGSLVALAGWHWLAAASVALVPTPNILKVPHNRELIADF